MISRRKLEYFSEFLKDKRVWSSMYILMDAHKHKYTHTYRMLLFLFYCQPCSVNDNGYLFNVYLFTDACEQIIESKVETDMPFFFSQKEDATSASLCSVILCTHGLALNEWFQIY